MAGEMIDRLRAAVAAVDPVPGGVSAAAVASLRYRRTDAHLAELVADSAMSPLAVRGGPYAPRLLTFTTSGLVIEVEVTSADTGRDLVGHLAPSRPGEVEIRWPGGARTTHADHSGHFTATHIPPGPISVFCRPASSPPVATTWTNI